MTSLCPRFGMVSLTHGLQEAQLSLMVGTRPRECGNPMPGPTPLRGGHPHSRSCDGFPSRLRPLAEIHRIRPTTPGPLAPPLPAKKSADPTGPSPIGEFMSRFQFPDGSTTRRPQRCARIGRSWPQRGQGVRTGSNGARPAHCSQRHPCSAWSQYASPQPHPHVQSSSMSPPYQEEPSEDGDVFCVENPAGTASSDNPMSPANRLH